MHVTAHTSVGAVDWLVDAGGAWGNIGVAVGEGVADNVASER